MEFRLEELKSLAILEQIDLQFNEETYSNESPFFIVELESKDDAKKLIKRSILVKEISELWAMGATQEELFDNIRRGTQKDREIYKTCSFKFSIGAYGISLSMKEQVERIEKCSWMAFQGPIDMKNPDVVFTYYEDYSEHKCFGKKLNSPPNRLFFGVLIANGNRSIVSQYDLKKREYLGTTSMDAELSLIMANQALARPGSLILDPFVGTGSFLVSCSHFGAYTIGSDIDGRQIRGNNGKDIKKNLAQYNLESFVLGTLVCDITRHTWRTGEWFDAIVCDPPYGVRAGAKKISSSTELKSPFKSNGERRYPEMIEYEMSELVADLIKFAATYLVVGGRLVFWLPTLNDEYVAEDIPSHPSMQLIANSEQNFGKWSRRLITMEKIEQVQNLSDNLVNICISKPGHSNFRTKYFNEKQ